MKSSHLILVMISAATIGPAKLTTTPETICTPGKSMPSANNTLLHAAAKSVCIRNTGIVYFDKNRMHPAQRSLRYI